MTELHLSPQIVKVPVRVTARLCQQRMPLSQLCRLAPGAVFSLTAPLDAELIVGNQTLAKGGAVRNGQKVGFRLSILTEDGHSWPSSRQG